MLCFYFVLKTAQATSVHAPTSQLIDRRMGWDNRPGSRKRSEVAVSKMVATATEGQGREAGKGQEAGCGSGQFRFPSLDKPKLIWINKLSVFNQLPGSLLAWCPSLVSTYTEITLIKRGHTILTVLSYTFFFLRSKFHLIQWCLRTSRYRIVGQFAE